MYRGGGEIISLDAISAGNATLTLSLSSDIDYNVPDPVDIDISVYDKLSLPPSEIQKFTRSGQAKNMYAVGDLFPIELNGTVGICDVTGNWYSCIIGIDHNPGIEGEYSIHFQFPYDGNGRGLCFIDENYEKYVPYSKISFCINQARSESDIYGLCLGGWKSSYAYNTLMPQFYGSLPSNWKLYIPEVEKWHDNVANSKNIPDNVSMSKNRCWYLAEWELHGVIYRANSAEQNYQRQYSYYINGGNKNRFKHNSQSSQAYYWLSSPICSGTTGFCWKGDSTACIVTRSWGASPCFAVG